jgi:hypothetical protein
MIPLTIRFIYLVLTSPPPADDKQIIVCAQHGDTLADQNVQPTSRPPSLTPVQGASSDSARTTERRRPSPPLLTTASRRLGFLRPLADRSMFLSLFQLSKDNSDAFLGGTQA